MFFAVEHVTVLKKSCPLSFCLEKSKRAQLLLVFHPYLSQNQCLKFRGLFWPIMSHFLSHGRLDVKCSHFKHHLTFVLLDGIVVAHRKTA